MNLRWLAVLNVFAAGVLVGRLAAGFEPIVAGPANLPLLPICFLATAGVMVVLQAKRQ